MPVYVDPVMNHGGSATFKWKDSCHLYADSEPELHAFAKKIGMRFAWFQKSRRGMPHYDLNRNKHARAIAQGAIQHTAREAVQFWQASGWMFQKGSELGKQAEAGTLFDE